MPTAIVSERSAFYFCGKRLLAAMGSHITGCRVDSVSRGWCSAPVIQSWFGSSRYVIYKLVCSRCFGRSWGNLVLCLETRVNPFPSNFCSLPYDLGKRWHRLFFYVWRRTLQIMQSIPQLGPRQVNELVWTRLDVPKPRPVPMHTCSTCFLYKMTAP